MENPQIFGAVGVRGKFLKTRELRRGKRQNSGSGVVGAAELGKAVIIMSGSDRVERWIVERCDEKYGRR